MEEQKIYLIIEFVDNLNEGRLVENLDGGLNTFLIKGHPYMKGRGKCLDFSTVRAHKFFPRIHMITTKRKDLALKLSFCRVAYKNSYAFVEASTEEYLSLLKPLNLKDPCPGLHKKKVPD